MDDICDSVDTVKEAHRLTKEMDEVLKTGGFSVKGWISNKMLTKGVKPNTEKGINVFEGEVEKVLGTTWNSKTDKFHFEVRASLLKVIETLRHVPMKMTKRMILNQVAQIYDLIGFAAAFIVKPKIGTATMAAWSRLGRGFTASDSAIMVLSVSRDERIGKRVL